MAITASAVKELRDITSAGMMACKKALTETDGDVQAAVKLLREKGIVKSAGRSDRETSEGIITTQVSKCGCKGVLIETNCETDFVAKNESFQAFVGEITDTVFNSDVTDPEAATALPLADGTIQDALGAKFAQLGEVIKIKQLIRYKAECCGGVSSYIHAGAKVGVMLEIGAEKEETAGTDAFKALSRDICLHIAATNPSGLTRDDIDSSTIEEENDINRKKLEAAGKPAQIIEKILVGQINKFFSEACLIDQAFVKDADLSIKQLLAAKSKELGDTLTIRRYVRYSIGA